MSCSPLWHQRVVQPVRVFGIICLAVLSGGCQHLMHVSNKVFHRTPVAGPDNPVVEVICIWEPAEGTGLDGLPCRGFAGQLLFFTPGAQAPAKVDGDIMVYVFDDQGTVEEQQKPIRQFSFDKSAVETFVTETNLGTAYQFFIPYTRKGSHRATCSLRVRYTPAYGGNPVYSKMASVILSGTSPRKPEAPIDVTEKLAPQTIQLAGHEVVVQDESVRSDRQQESISWGGDSKSQGNPDFDKQRLLNRLQEVRNARSAAGQLEQSSAPAPGKKESSGSSSAVEHKVARHPLALKPAAQVSVSSDDVQQEDQSEKDASLNLKRHPLLED